MCGGLDHAVQPAVIVGYPNVCCDGQLRDWSIVIGRSKPFVRLLGPACSVQATAICAVGGTTLQPAVMSYW